MSERIQQYLHRRQCYGDRYSPYGGIPKNLFAQNIYADRYTLSRMTLDKKLEGHSGCVNTLFWSSRGDKLVSGSDDAKAIIWFPQENYRKACSIETGHRANIFSAKFMPSTSDSILVTASADSEVRVFDINDGNNGGLKSTLRHVYYCHINSVKSIAIENGNPHEFLTCAEDGTVRHFDIRQPHKCTPTVSHSSFAPSRETRQHHQACTGRNIREGCPAPLLDYGQHFRLNSLALNQINPQYFAVGGMDAYVYLHDRRMVGNSGGGASRRPSIDASTRCIRRFKPRPSQNHSINLYVTSCKFSDYNGEELLGSWSSGEIGLFDIHDTTPDELTEISWGKSTQEKISGSPQNFNVQTNRLPTPKEIQDHIRSGNFERALECLEAYFDPLRRPNSDQVENDIEKIWYLSLSAALRLHRVYERVGWSFDSLENLSTEEESSTSEELIGKAESVAPNTWRGMWCLAIGLFLSSGGPGQATCEHRRSWLIKARYYAYLAYMTFQENEAANGPSDYETVPSVGAESVNNKLMMMKEFLSEVEKAVEQDTNTESSHDENEITERELETRALPSSLRWKWIDKMYLPKFDTAGEFAGPASGSVSTSNNILQYRDSDSNDNDISQDEYGTEDDVLMVGPDFNSSDEERLEHLTFAATHDSRFDSAENSEREDSLSERENDPITFNDIIALNNPGDDLRHPRREFFSSIMSEEEDEEENDGDDEEFELSIDPSRPRFSEIIYHFSRRNRSYLENNTPILGSEKIYNGHCNIMTTKEVNFFGPKDEYIVSGSDDGFLFVWDKNTTEIVQILQGDQDTVNVIQGHPFLPHMAVSGIDNTIKIFTPTSGPFTTSARKEPRLKTSYSPSSRMFEKDAIVERNIETHLSEPLIVEDNLYMDAENFLHDDPSLAVFLAEVSRI